MARFTKIAGYLLFPFAWVALKYGLHVSDRYLPDPVAVLRSATAVDPSVVIHTSYTVARFGIGFVFGTCLGIGLALFLHRWDDIHNLLIPIVQSSRAIPAVAMIPFFILWFGFSEFGRYLLVLSGTAFNVAIAGLQILDRPPERYRVMFESFGLRPNEFPLRYGLPAVCNGVLPTLRFSLASAIGLIVASEMLGSQIGLGYLAQTARATFSLDLLFFVVIILGAISSASDWLLIRLWRAVVFWKGDV